MPMPSFSSLVGVSVTTPESMAPYLGMIPPSLDSPRTYKPCTLHKPSKGSGDQRWLLIWWQYSPTHGKVVRRRQGLDLASYPNPKDRERRAGEWSGVINTLLKAGYVYGEAVEVSSPLVQNWPTLWEGFEAHRAHLSPSRLLTYTKVRGLWEEWTTAQGITPSGLSPTHKSSFLTFLKGCKGRFTNIPFGVATRNQYQAAARAFGKWCSEEGHLTPDQLPFFGVKKEKEAHSPRHKPFTQAQLSQVLAKAQGNAQLTLFLHLCYYTLARPRKELSRLQVRDIEDTTLYIIPAHDKGRVGRRCLIPPPLEVLLAPYRGLPQDLYLFTKHGKPGPKPVGHVYFYNLFRDILRELEWEGMDHTLYSLKMSGNIALWKATQSLDLLRRQNGHSHISITERYLRQLGIVLNMDQITQFPVMGAIP